MFTITPDQPTLNAGATSTVALDGVLDNVMNFTGGEFTGTAQTLMMLSPSLNVNVTTLVSTISVPAGATLLTYPPGFGISSSISVISRQQKALRPIASETYLGFNDTTQAGFTPISVNNVVRTIVPSANGSPTVQDEFSIHNIANYNLTQIPVKLLAPGLETVTVLPNTQPPLQNPTVITLSGGVLSFKSANIASPLLANSNITITLAYPLPASLMTVTGSTVKITVPYTPIVGSYVRNYSIILAAGKGISTSGPTEVLDKPVTPLTTGSVQFTYSLSVGWAADQAVPAGIFVFAVAFAMFAVQRTATEEEEGEKAIRKTSDVLRAFEEKTGLETQYMNEFASAPKGSISRADFDRMRNEINELRTRALQRLNADEAGPRLRKAVRPAHEGRGSREGGGPVVQGPAQPIPAVSRQQDERGDLQEAPARIQEEGGIRDQPPLGPAPRDADRRKVTKGDRPGARPSSTSPGLNQPTGAPSRSIYRCYRDSSANDRSDERPRDRGP